MAYSKTLLRKGIKRRDARICRKGAQNKAVKVNGPGLLTKAEKYHKNH